MDANRKRNRGVLKGKLAPFFKAPTKPSSTVQYTTATTTTTTTKNVKPNHSSPSPASVGFVVHKDYAITQPNPKVSIVVTDCWSDNMPIDESVDVKAGIYISMVQQRLMLEQVQEN